MANRLVEGVERPGGRLAPATSHFGREEVLGLAPLLERSAGDLPGPGSAQGGEVLLALHTPRVGDDEGDPRRRVGDRRIDDSPQGVVDLIGVAHDDECRLVEERGPQCLGKRWDGSVIRRRHRAAIGVCPVALARLAARLLQRLLHEDLFGSRDQGDGQAHAGQHAMGPISRTTYAAPPLPDIHPTSAPYRR